MSALTRMGVLTATSHYNHNHVADEHPWERIDMSDRGIVMTCESACVSVPLGIVTPAVAAAVDCEERAEKKLDVNAWQRCNATRNALCAALRPASSITRRSPAVSGQFSSRIRRSLARQRNAPRLSDEFRPH